ncbi:PP2C family protein-serine/threonine phosphatase [Bernardetia sp.]|uniref:PP2C family protein-serine/threonine phosphatase n=1 Tax=Bernardetia sp. TaxID=1937974 RepID=UPI0025BB6555|nr:SpoIIE family protein phosphatase [Bernardetia sp.]
MSFIRKYWQKISAFGIDSSIERVERQRIRLLNQINFLVLFFVPPFLIIHFFTDWRVTLLIFLIGCGFVVSLYLNKKKLYSVARTFTFMLFWGTSFSFSILLGKESTVNDLFYGVAVSPFILYPVKNRIRITLLLIFSLISAIALFWLQETELLPPLLSLPTTIHYLLSTLIIIMVILVIALLVGSLSKHHQESEKELLEKLQETESLNAITQKQNAKLALTEKSLQDALRQVESDKKEIIAKNNELQAQEEKLRKQVDENKIQLRQIEEQEEVMRMSFEELQEKTEQMAVQEEIMQQAMEELYHINKKLQDSEQRLEKEVRRRTEQIASQNKALEHSYLALESKTRTLHESINYAKHIQNAILPPKTVVKALFSDSFIFYKPRDVVSGDFYWLDRKVDIDGNMRIAIAAVDCTGHGVPGAIMSMIGYNLLNQFSNKATLAEPHLLTQKLHEGVINSLQQKVTANRDGMDLSLCVYDTENQTIDFVGAKNPLIYIQNNQLHEIKGTNASIGGAFYENRKVCFKKHTIDVSQPTTIYLYSDGYQDQFGGKKGRKFMKSKFKKMLFENHHKPMEEQYKIFRTTFNKWRANEDQVDDVLLIGLKVN